MLDGIEGRKAVAIVEACYRSARTGRSAKVEDPA
jgi:predicted dehydrogenase